MQEHLSEILKILEKILARQEKLVEVVQLIHELPLNSPTRRHLDEIRAACRTDTTKVQKLIAESS